MAAIKDARNPAPMKRQTVSDAKAAIRERAAEAARQRFEQLLSKLPPVTQPRKHRLRPSAAAAFKPKSIAELRKLRAEWLRAHRDRQGNHCAYCLRLMNSWSKSAPDLRATLDHVIPLSKGGDDSFENTVAACTRCNGEKSDTLPDQYKALWALRHATARAPQDQE